MEGLTMNMIKKYIGIVVVSIAFSATAQAQLQHFTSGSLGMGGGGTAYVDGFHANFVNPANLMLKRFRRPDTFVGFGGLGVRAGGTLSNLPAYNEYLSSGLTITGQTREDLLNALFDSEDPSQSRNIATSLDVVPFGFSKRGRKSAVSLALRSRVLTRADVSRGGAEVFFFGLDADQFSSPRNVDLSLETVAFGEVSLGYARQILSLPNFLFARNVKVYVGVAPKLLISAFSTSLDFASTLQVQRGPNGQATRLEHNFDYTITTFGDLAGELSAFEAERRRDSFNADISDFLGESDGEYVSPTFSGIGFDIGGTIEMDISRLPLIPLFGKKKTLTVAASITDIGKVIVDDNPMVFTNSRNFVFEGAPDGQEVDDFYDVFGDSVSNDVYLNFTGEETGEISTRLPSTLNLGAHLTMGKLSTSIDYSVGFNGNSTSSQFSSLTLGAEYRLLNFIPLRVGVRNGGFSSRVYTAGAGIDFRFLELTFAAAIPSTEDRNGSAVAAAWSGLVFRF